MDNIKIKTFRFNGSRNKYKQNDKSNECYYHSTEKIDNDINTWIKDNNVFLVDIKITTIELNYHNNCGYNQVDLLYTIMYK